MSPAVILPSPRGFKVELAGPLGEGAQADLLHVEEELDRVLLHARDGGELVLHLFDADGRDGGAGEGAEEDAPQGVA